MLNSYDVFGSPHTFNVVWASAKLYEGEPKVVQAFLSAVKIAMKEINEDPAGSAALWVKADKSKLTPAQAEKIIRDTENKWTMTPEQVMVVADYMSRVKMIPVGTEELEGHVHRLRARSAGQLRRKTGPSTNDLRAARGERGNAPVQDAAPSGDGDVSGRLQRPARATAT